MTRRGLLSRLLGVPLAGLVVLRPPVSKIVLGFTIDPGGHRHEVALYRGADGLWRV